MSILTEGEISIDFKGVKNAVKFDDPARHQLSCFSAVDFVVEIQNRIYLIEIKHPMTKGSLRERRKKFIDELCAGKIDEKLVKKYRDSFLSKWGENSLGNSELYYIILIGYERLNSAELQRRKDEIKRKLPSNVSILNWKRQIVTGVAVLKFSTWRKMFPDFTLNVTS